MFSGVGAPPRLPSMPNLVDYVRTPLQGKHLLFLRYLKQRIETQPSLLEGSRLMTLPVIGPLVSKAGQSGAKV